MRRPVLLFGFLGLLALGVFLMWLSERSGVTETRPRRSPPVFPSRFNPAQFERAEQRRTMLPAPSAQPHERRDPLLVALPDSAPTTVVFEAAVIRDSPVGQLAMKCLQRDIESDRSKQANTVLQFVSKLDRLAITNGLLAATGDFSDIDWPDDGHARDEERKYGDRGRILQGRDQEGPALATHGTNIVLAGETRANVEQSMDRLEDRVVSPGKGVAPDIAYGDIYGKLDASIFDDVLPTEIASTWKEVAKSVELHVDVQDDVLITADVMGKDAERLGELGRTIAGALSVARVHAKATGDEKLGQILEYARVLPSRHDFRLELALPAELVSKALAACNPPAPAPSR